MEKKAKIFSLLSIVLGWFLLGFGYTTNLGHPISTISFLLGIVCIIGGLLMLIVWPYLQNKK
jgi:hypothetical protein